MILLSLLSGSLLLSLNTFAEQQPSIAPSNQIVLTGQTLTLENDQQRCALRKPDQSLFTLDMPWPCQLSVDRKGLPRVETFNDALIIIVQHFEPEPAPSTECHSQYQAIRQIAGRLEASIVADGGRCLRGAVDQKNFVGLFSW